MSRKRPKFTFKKEMRKKREIERDKEVEVELMHCGWFSAQLLILFAEDSFHANYRR